MEWRAEELLQKMNELSREHDFPCKPDQFSFNTVISCWARVSYTDAPCAVAAFRKITHGFPYRVINMELHNEQKRS
jgi:hypothetical protein